MSAPPPQTQVSTGRTNSELNRVAPGSTSATSGATNTSVSAGKARFQTEATAPSPVDMSAPSRGIAREGIRVGSRDIPESASIHRGAGRGGWYIIPRSHKLRRERVLAADERGEIVIVKPDGRVGRISGEMSATITAPDGAGIPRRADGNKWSMHSAGSGAIPLRE